MFVQINFKKDNSFIVERATIVKRDDISNCFYIHPVKDRELLEKLLNRPWQVCLGDNGKLVDTPTWLALRLKNYPPIEDYLDAVVKSDQTAIDAYISKCLEIKGLYPKPE